MLIITGFYCRNYIDRKLYEGLIKENCFIFTYVNYNNRTLTEKQDWVADITQIQNLQIRLTFAQLGGHVYRLNYNLYFVFIYENGKYYNII